MKALRVPGHALLATRGPAGQGVCQCKETSTSSRANAIRRWHRAHREHVAGIVPAPGTRSTCTACGRTAPIGTPVEHKDACPLAPPAPVVEEPEECDEHLTWTHDLDVPCREAAADDADAWSEDR